MKNQKPDAQFRQLSLWNVSFAFAILGFGVGGATLSFVIEFIYRRIIKKNQQQVIANVHPRVNVIDSNKTKIDDKPAAAAVEGNVVKQRQVNKVKGAESIKETKNLEKPSSVAAVAIEENIRKRQLKVEGNRNVIIESKKQPNMTKTKPKILETLVVVDIENEPSPIGHKKIEEIKANTTRIIEKGTTVVAAESSVVDVLVHAETAKEPKREKNVVAESLSVAENSVSIKTATKEPQGTLEIKK